MEQRPKQVHEFFVAAQLFFRHRMQDGMYDFVTEDLLRALRANPVQQAYGHVLAIEEPNGLVIAPILFWDDADLNLVSCYSEGFWDHIGLWNISG